MVKGHSDRSEACYLLVQAGVQARRQWRCFQLAMHYRKRGDVGEAYRWFQHSVEAGDNEAHLALAKIWLHERENTPKAIKHLKAVFQGNSRDVSELGRDEARTMLRRLRAAHR